MFHHPVRIPLDDAILEGDLAVPDHAQAIILFAHGSGSSRKSPRNRFVARSLRDAGLGTLLIDLLTSEEEAIDDRTREYRFNISLLTERLTGAVDWLLANDETKGLQIGLFGASTGTPAAIFTAVKRPNAIYSIVSRGGRPDLATAVLHRVNAPTLLIVGGDDYSIIDLNTEAAKWIRAPKKIEIVPGSTHLFEEPGALEDVARLARKWFTHHLAAVPQA